MVQLESVSVYTVLASPFEVDKPPEDGLVVLVCEVVDEQVTSLGGEQRRVGNYVDNLDKVAVVDAVVLENDEAEAVGRVADDVQTGGEDDHERQVAAGLLLLAVD